jgi:hypothetical protein
MRPSEALDIFTATGVKILKSNTNLCTEKKVEIKNNFTPTATINSVRFKS